jgi:hypothetical protein
MTLQEAVKFVAGAYGVVLVVFFAYYWSAARRLRSLERQVRALKDTLDKREKTAAGGEDHV